MPALRASILPARAELHGAKSSAIASPNRGARSVAAAFAGWGIRPRNACAGLARSQPRGVLVASGGIASGLDVVKAMALGADLAGIAGPFLRAAAQGYDAASDLAREFVRCCASRCSVWREARLADLRETDRIVARVPERREPTASADAYCRRPDAPALRKLHRRVAFRGRARLDLARIYAFCRTTDDLGDESGRRRDRAGAAGALARSKSRRCSRACSRCIRCSDRAARNHRAALCRQAAVSGSDRGQRAGSARDRSTARGLSSRLLHALGRAGRPHGAARFRRRRSARRSGSPTTSASVCSLPITRRTSAATPDRAAVSAAGRYRRAAARPVQCEHGRTRARAAGVRASARSVASRARCGCNSRSTAWAVWRSAMRSSASGYRTEVRGPVRIEARTKVLSWFVP